MDNGRVAAPAELFDLSGRSAIVTGGSSGLGSRFVRVLAAAGAEVLVAARRADRLESLYDDMEGVNWIACDVSNDADRERLIDLAFASGQTPSILVNNAAVAGKLSASDEDPAQFAEVLDVNLTACYALARDLVECTPEPASSCIINVASILGLVAGSPMGGAGYAASKAGLIGLTRELAAQWGPLGVRVNALAPGWFASEMTQDLLAHAGGERWIRRNTVLERPGSEWELDTALLMLASPHSSYMTGHTLIVDGGWTVR